MNTLEEATLQVVAGKAACVGGFSDGPLAGGRAAPCDADGGAHDLNGGSVGGSSNIR